MAIAHYLAMTGAELAAAARIPERAAWMACHFSPYGTGLSNLPVQLPGGTVLMLNDRTPISGHDPRRIAQQLGTVLEKWNCPALVLDFQRENNPETQALTSWLVQAYPELTVVSLPYAYGLDCPVFLPPCPPDQPLEDFLAPWKDRKIWLELSLERQEIILTAQGAQTIPCSLPESLPAGQAEPRLHCHYTVQLTDDQAVFTLWRTPEDLAQLLAQAETLGVLGAMSLYQQLPEGLPEPSQGRQSEVAQ